jgi:hypothetical protein
MRIFIFYSSRSKTIGDQGEKAIYGGHLRWRAAQKGHQARGHVEMQQGTDQAEPAGIWKPCQKCWPFLAMTGAAATESRSRTDLEQV